MTNLSDSTLAALANDSYLRGYHSKIIMPDTEMGLPTYVNTNVGVGTLIATKSSPNDEFFATAYQFGNEIVISYRGANNLSEFTLWPFDGPDADHVYDLDNGETTTQLYRALEFFNEILARPGVEEGDIVLTGHSLGGALAGAVAAFKGVEAVMFENTGFVQTVHSMQEWINNSNHRDHDTYLKNLVLSTGDPNRTEFNPSAIRTIALENDVAGIRFRSTEFWRTLNDDVISENLYGVGKWLAPTEAHTMSLTAMTMYAKDHGYDEVWKNSTEYFFSSINNDLYGDILEIGHYPTYASSGVLKDALVYSGLGGSTNPFGDSAIKAFFSDAVALGSAIVDGFELPGDGIASKITEYAAYLLKHSVFGQTSGFLNYVNGWLSADFSAVAWTFDGIAVDQGVSVDGYQYNTGVQLDEIQMGLLATTPGKTDYTYYATDVSSALVALGTGSGTIYGTSLDDIITGTSGNDVMYGRDGGDTFSGRGGNNLIYGGNGVAGADDRVIFEGAWSDYWVQIQDQVIYVTEKEINGSVNVLHSIEQLMFGEDLFNSHDPLLFNKSPTQISFLENSNDGFYGVVEEGDIGGRLLGYVTGEDPNDGDILTWSLAPESAAFFDIDPETGAIYGKAGVSFDYDYWFTRAGLTNQYVWSSNGFVIPALNMSNPNDAKYGVHAIATDTYGETFEKTMSFFKRCQIWRPCNSYGYLWRDV